MAAPMPLSFGRAVPSASSASRAFRATAMRPRLQMPRAGRQQRFYSAEQPTGNKDKVKFWPFLLLIGAGTAGYIGLVNRRKGAY